MTDKIHTLLDFLKEEKNASSDSEFDKGYAQAMQNAIDQIMETMPEEYDSWPERPFNDESVPSDWWSGGIADNH